MLLHINPTRQRGKRTGSLARASGWYMTFFAAGVIVLEMRGNRHDKHEPAPVHGHVGLTGGDQLGSLEAGGIKRLDELLGER